MLQLKPVGYQGRLMTKPITNSPTWKDISEEELHELIFRITTRSHTILGAALAINYICFQEAGKNIIGGSVCFLGTFILCDSQNLICVCGC